MIHKEMLKGVNCFHIDVFQCHDTNSGEQPSDRFEFCFPTSSLEQGLSTKHKNEV